MCSLEVVVQGRTTTTTTTTTTTMTMTMTTTMTMTMTTTITTVTTNKHHNDDGPWDWVEHSITTRLSMLHLLFFALCVTATQCNCRDGKDGAVMTKSQKTSECSSDHLLWLYNPSKPDGVDGFSWWQRQRRYHPIPPDTNKKSTSNDSQ